MTTYTCTVIFKMVSLLELTQIFIIMLMTTAKRIAYFASGKFPSTLYKLSNVRDDVGGLDTIIILIWQMMTEKSTCLSSLGWQIAGWPCKPLAAASRSCPVYSVTCLITSLVYIQNHWVWGIVGLDCLPPNGEQHVLWLLVIWNSFSFVSIVPDFHNLATTNSISLMHSSQCLFTS